MPNLQRLRVETITALLARFEENGVTAEMVQEVVRDVAFARAVCATMTQHPRFSFVHGLFTATNLQLARIRELNEERGWGYTEEDFEKAALRVPDWPEARLAAVTLVPYLPEEAGWGTVRVPSKTGRAAAIKGGVERTFHELWHAIIRSYPKSWRYEEFELAGPDKLRLVSGAEHPAVGDGRGRLRWEVIDLGANLDGCPVDIRHPETSPHAGVMAAALLHPKWVTQMNGREVPYVWLPGYEFSAAGELPWRRVPTLGYFQKEQKVALHAGWFDRHRPATAVPYLLT